MDYRLDSLSYLNNYYKWIFDEFTPFIGKRVMEIGAGIGTFSKVLLQESKIERLFLVEPMQESLGELQKIFGNNPKVNIISSNVEAITSETIRDLEIDTIICVNVMEHIKEDKDVLTVISNGLKPGGRILTFSPAFQILYSHIDQTAGHCRRYTKNEIKQRLEDAGFTVIYCRYFNFIGFFLWLFFVKMLHADDFNVKGLGIYDKIIPFLQKIEKVISPPVGQSVIAVGEVKGR